MIPGELYEWRDALSTAPEPEHGTFLREERPHPRGGVQLVFEDADGDEFSLAAWRVKDPEVVEV